MFLPFVSGAELCKVRAADKKREQEVSRTLGNWLRDEAYVKLIHKSDRSSGLNGPSGIQLRCFN